MNYSGLLSCARQTNLQFGENRTLSRQLLIQTANATRRLRKIEGLEIPPPINWIRLIKNCTICSEQTERAIRASNSSHAQRSDNRASMKVRQASALRTDFERNGPTVGRRHLLQELFLSLRSVADQLYRRRICWVSPFAPCSSNFHLYLAPISSWVDEMALQLASALQDMLKGLLRPRFMSERFSGSLT